MKRRFFALCMLALFLAGCGAYKELKPKPPVASAEGGYIELTKSVDDDTVERFELKQGKKYFIRFPAPLADHMYLALKTDQKNLISAYLTPRFSQKGQNPRIQDESGGQPGLSVYRIDRATPESFWVIETVSQDLLLTLEYRYLPVWRYHFENRYAEFLDGLSRNRVDRTVYTTLGDAYHFNNFDFAGALNEIQKKYDNLQTSKSALQTLESLFPPDILNSDDPAYRDYVDLRDGLNGEIRFQDDYRAVLTAFRTEMETRSNMAAFLDASPRIVEFLNQTSRFPAPVLNEAKTVFGARLPGVVPFMEQRIAAKNDISPITFGFDLASVDALYRACGQTAPPAFTDMVRFIHAYNDEVERLAPSRSKLAEAERYGSGAVTWPSDGYYREALGHIAELNRLMPTARTVSFDAYDRFRCVTLLNGESQRIREQATRLGRDYAIAQGVVQQINRLRNDRDYRAIIELLLENRRLGFLIAQYPDVDQRSLEAQQSAITVALAGRDWLEAETGIRNLHLDEAFLRLDRIAGLKATTVRRMEGELASAVEQVSRQRALAFIDSNKLAVQNIDALYSDPVFTPVYELTFTSGAQNDLTARNTNIKTTLENLKTVQFAETAVPALYREFTRAINNDGVARARAIVAHGRQYKGSNRQVINLVAECDPTAPKWITKPTEYRKVYVLPVTSNAGGTNEYLFRLNIRIPSEARFPVFDVNIKLPKEVAENATTAQWYDTMTLNGNVLKPEGRFTITAPTAANNYEAQLTPVQVRANEDNILEVRFTQPSFRVFEISAMSQRPIMRKD